MFLLVIFVGTSINSQVQLDYTDYLQAICAVGLKPSFDHTDYLQAICAVGWKPSFCRDGCEG